MTHVSGWRVVVPVKGGDGAKSRLALPAPARRALATAMALDCLEAALATAGVDCVVCVSDDPAIARLARGVGAATASAGRPGLAAAVDAGLAVLAPGPAAVLLGDLPALRPEELQRALAAAAASDVPVVVADADGGGSVLLAGRRTASGRPRPAPTSRPGRGRCPPPGRPGCRACAGTWTPSTRSPRPSPSASAPAPAPRWPRAPSRSPDPEGTRAHPPA
ncbi:NTP transferase domain-containing protein, partial [Kineococcus vitellinus]|uniref:NTP transferase domain-containing protein n=1 Tax=Kineococcus vitellinus TaxID=2696565 RepID=UPI00196B00DA